MDTCRSRWMAAVKAAHGSSKDMQTAASKADSLKDELDDGIIKFESCQVWFKFLWNNHQYFAVFNHQYLCPFSSSKIDR